MAKAKGPNARVGKRITNASDTQPNALGYAHKHWLWPNGPYALGAWPYWPVSLRLKA